MSPTTSSPAPRAPPATSPPPRGSSRKRPSGSKTWPTCSPTTTRPPSSSPSAAGQTDQAAELEAPALRFLGLAGERALGLDTAAALASFERALALTPAGHPERAAALARFGEAALHAGRFAEARGGAGGGDRRVPGSGRRSRRRPGDGHARRRCSTGSGIRAWWTLPAEALALLEPLPPGPELVAALTELAVAEALQGRNEAGIGYAEQALVARRAARARPARPRARLSAAWPAATSATAAGSTTSGRRSRSPPRPGRAARSRCCTTTSGSALLRLEGPVASPGGDAGGDRLRGGPRPHRARRPRSSASTLDALVETGEHEQALALATELADRYEASGDVSTSARCGPCRRGS